MLHIALIAVELPLSSEKPTGSPNAERVPSQPHDKLPAPQPDRRFYGLPYTEPRKFSGTGRQQTSEQAHDGQTEVAALRAEVKKLSSSLTEMNAKLGVNRHERERLRRVNESLRAELGRYRDEQAGPGREPYTAGRVTHESDIRAVRTILPAADAAFLAGRNGGMSGALKSVSVELDKALSSVGVEQFAQIGDTFDPRIHHAVDVTHGDKTAVDRVSEVLRPGYRRGTTVLRPAAVAVGA